MPNPLSRVNKLLSCSVVVLLLLSGAGTAQSGGHPDAYYIKSTVRAPSSAVLPVVRVPSSPKAVNSSCYIHTEKNSDLVINIPDAAGRSYKLIFFEGDRLLFQVSVAGQPYLIMEKNNFGHAGLFRYELFREDVLVERNNFIIKND